MAGGRLGDVELSLTGSYYQSAEPNLADAYRDDYEWFHGRYQDGKALVFGHEVDVPVEDFAMPTRSYFVDARMNIADFRFGYTRHSDLHSSSAPGRPEHSLYIEDAKYGYSIQSFFGEHRYASDDGKLRIRTSGHVGTYDLDTESRYVNQFVSFQGGYKYEQHLVARMETRVSYDFGDWLDATLGVSYQDFSGQPKTADLQEPWESDEAADSQVHNYPGTDIGQDYYHYRYQNIGVFAELQSSPIEWLTATAGVRYDHNTRYGPSITPRAGVAMTPAKGTSIKVLYGQAFLAPSPYTTYQHFGSFYNTQSGGLGAFFWRLPNEDLKPERLQMFELGLSQRVADVVNLRLDGWYATTSDLINTEISSGQQFKGVDVNTVSRPINQGAGSTYGVTASASAVWKPGQFRINPWLAYTWSDGEVDDEPITLHATHVLKGGLDLGWRRLSLSTQLQFRTSSLNGAQVDDDGDALEVDGFFVLDAYLRYRGVFDASWGGLSAWVRARNVLDNRYYHPSNATDTLTGAPQDPIRITGGLDLHF